MRDSRKTFKDDRRSKYGSQQCIFMDEKFDSRREMKRYIFLLGEQKAGRISGLRRQVRYDIFPDEYADVEVQLKTKVKLVQRRTYIGVYYVADFVYEWQGKTVVEDVKISPSLLPKDYVLKEKMMHYILGVDIRRVFNPTAPAGYDAET